MIILELNEINLDNKSLSKLNYLIRKLMNLNAKLLRLPQTY